MKNLNYSISDTRPLDMVIIEKLSSAVKQYKQAWIDCQNAEHGKIPRQLSNPNFYHNVRARYHNHLKVVLDELDDLGSMYQAPVETVDTFMVRVNKPLYYLLQKHHCVRNFNDSLYVLDQLDHFLNMSKVYNRHESFNEVKKIFDKVKESD